MNSISITLLALNHQLKPILYNLKHRRVKLFNFSFLCYSSSKLVCMHFACWDNNKEWTVDMPSGENIKVNKWSDVMFQHEMTSFLWWIDFTKGNFIFYNIGHLKVLKWETINIFYYCRISVKCSLPLVDAPIRQWLEHCATNLEVLCFWSLLIYVFIRWLSRESTLSHIF